MTTQGRPIAAGDYVAALRPGRFDYSGVVDEVRATTVVVRFGDGAVVVVPNRREFVESMQLPIEIATTLATASGNGKRLEQDASDGRILQRAGELDLEIPDPYTLSRIRWVLEQLWSTGQPTAAGEA